MPLIFQQLFEAESSTYTYLLADGETREALLIDPVLETARRDLALIEELGLKLLYTLETHCHADHVTSAEWFAKRLGSRAIAHESSGVRSAELVKAGDVVQAGNIALTTLHTPGHTAGDVCFHMRGRVFTGDTLLIGGCGRTDFQQGNAGQLFDSVKDRLFTLPDETLVFPAHDYQGRTHSSIGDEKRSNPRLAGTTKEQFIDIMDNLGLDYPEQIDRAVPANEQGGADTEPYQHPVHIKGKQFFAIPDLYLVGFGNGKNASDALPRELELHCAPGGWKDCLSSIPLSRTVGLVGETGQDCLPFEAGLTQAGYDVVILDGGWAAMDAG